MAPPAGAKTAIVAASSRGETNAASDQFASVDISTSNAPNYTGCAAGTDRVRITVWDLSAAALVNQDVYIWFEN